MARGLSGAIVFVRTFRMMNFSGRVMVKGLAGAFGSVGTV